MASEERKALRSCGACFRRVHLMREGNKEAQRFIEISYSQVNKKKERDGGY